METAEKVDWATLNVHAAGRPARRLVSKAIAAAGGDRAAGVVLDLGAGAGADSLQFARRGWTVHAYDADDTIAARLVENERMSGSVQFHHTDITDVDAFPRAQIVYSTYTLGLLGPEGLAATWPKLVDALPRGGVMAVDVFGTNDSWADRPDIATLSMPEIDAMFRGFQIIDRSVRDEDGRFLADKKHWHVITTLARKLS
ncbi:class I SAM-dependent methyltransferase [Brachybacterium muris]|uniref:class I SAM-dependent methyltransferase n=1 Tax=Brachybacterium muris TaxID=219301 RepID=UPI00223A7BBB|nr:class I SAM-dependent methyltransferase [Brachybacterium muris]MCT2262629.1 class I SAM-dependent methyltransferase [Brachybacterium muris]MCT2296566.1 class I SAM-dependent methyltransferase [Brachybacterium muris]